MQNVCAIDSKWLPELAPHFFEVRHDNEVDAIGSPMSSFTNVVIRVEIICAGSWSSFLQVRTVQQK